MNFFSSNSNFDFLREATQNDHIIFLYKFENFVVLGAVYMRQLLLKSFLLYVFTFDDMNDHGMISCIGRSTGIFPSILWFNCVNIQTRYQNGFFFMQIFSCNFEICFICFGDDSNPGPLIGVVDNCVISVPKYERRWARNVFYAAK